MAEAVIEVRDASFHYHVGFPIFEHVSFSVARGQVMTLLGPNGAGKSTLLNCIAGLAAPTSGQILIGGTDVSQMSPKQIARKLAYVPQTIKPTYGYSVREYMVMGAAPRIGMFETPSAEEYERVEQAIEALELQKLADRTVSHLSGGERQRVAIARAIVQDPEAILFDEPTSALDYGNQIRVLRTAAQLLAERNYAIVMTTHNPDHPILLGGQVAILDASGRLTVGPVDEAITEERLSELYGIPLRLVHVPEVDRLACLSGKL